MTKQPIVFTKSDPLDQSLLYALSSRKSLATLLGTALGRLQALADQPDNYRVLSIENAGKKRVIEIPKPALRQVQRRIFELLDGIEKPDYLHSARKQRSYITNARVHVGAVPLLKLDLKQFYPSVDRARIYRFFKDALKCSPDVSGPLAKLCTVDGHVPTGSCTSQSIAFFASKALFDDLHFHSVLHQVRDSYYVDDLTWSGLNATPSFLWGAKQIIHRHGFKYHGERCYTAEQRKLVTGVLIVGDEIKVRPLREFELWSAIHSLAMPTSEDHLKKLDALLGKAAANSQVEPRFSAMTRKLRLLKAREKARLSQPTCMPTTVNA